MTEKLLPCPFCGGEAILESNKLRYGTIYSAYCQKCGAEITGFSEHEAIVPWNRRPDARQLALKTGVCPMCEDCPDGCPIETPKDSRNIVTNGDRIWRER